MQRVWAACSPEAQSLSLRVLLAAVPVQRQMPHCALEGAQTRVQAGPLKLPPITLAGPERQFKRADQKGMHCSPFPQELI